MALTWRLLVWVEQCKADGLDGPEFLVVERPIESQWGLMGDGVHTWASCEPSRGSWMVQLAAIRVRGCIREREEEVDPRRVILVAVCLSSVPLSEANWICLLYLGAL